MTVDTRAHVRQVVKDWLAVERGTSLHEIRVTRSAYASSATLLNAHLVLGNGERMRVVYKETAAPPAAGPAFIVDPLREAWMYEWVLPYDGVVDAPRLLASGSAEGGGHWLLMEWSGSVDLGQVGAQQPWCEAAAQAARLHTWGESRVDEIAAGSVVRWDDPELHLLWASRAERARDGLGPLWRHYDVVAERLAAMPKTLVHGDLNAANVLVSTGARTRRIRFIDWETAGIGPGLLDLASLTSGRLPERHRNAMVGAYRANLSASAIGALSDREFDEALSWCRLAQAVRWLGWSPGWSAPAAHAFDWNAEALILARRLGLMGRA